MANEPEFLTRRRFFAALAASVVVAGLPLPVGMPTEVVTTTVKYAWHDWGSMTFVWAPWGGQKIIGKAAEIIGGAPIVAAS
jgi:hypothetical protein